MGMKIEALQRLDLGICGEHNATVIRIDCNGWKQQYPNGVISLYHQRKGDEDMGVTGATYDMESGILTWSVTETDTTYEGVGMAEIRLTDGTVTKKKKKVYTVVRPGVIGEGDTPISSNMQAYINEMERIKGQLGSEAEAWARGTRNGIPVEETDETYQNNGKYYTDSLGSVAQGYIDAIEEAGRIAEALIPGDLTFYASVQSVTNRLAAFGYVEDTTLILEEPEEEEEDEET